MRRWRRHSLRGLALACAPFGPAFAQEEPAAEGVHFDLEIRERIEVADRLALRPGDERDVATAYHRILAGVLAKEGPVSGYVQLGGHGRSGGRGAAPAVARNDIDLQQAYLEFSIGTPERGVRVRGGRAEMAFELVASRDAPNVRRAWDGVRTTATSGGWTVDAFAARVVEPQTGAFDDNSRSGDRLRGVHVAAERKAIGPFGLSAFFYDVDQKAVSLLAGTARARTTTLGAVLDGELGGFEWSAGGARQTGRFGNRPVRAFYLEGEVGRKLDGPWAPRLGVRASLFSGGPPDGSRIRTFKPLFPNFAYSTEAALQSPSNLLKVAALAELKPTRALTVEYRGEGLWRHSSADAYYVPTGFAAIPPRPGASRWSGFQQQLKGSWKVDRHLTLVGALVRFDAARALRVKGRGSATLALLQATLSL